MEDNKTVVEDTTKETVTDTEVKTEETETKVDGCLLYTSDAADE